MPFIHSLKIITMNTKIKKLIPIVALFPMCLNAITYTADPGAGSIDINGGATFDSSGGNFNSSADLFGNGDLTVQGGGTVRFLASSGASTFTGSIFLNSQTAYDAVGFFGNNGNVINIGTSLFRSRNGGTLENDIVVLQNTQIDNATTGTTLTINGNVATNFNVFLGTGFNIADRNVAVVGVVSGSGGLSNGNGPLSSTFSLQANNTYSGTTLVRSGLWNVNGMHNAQSDYTVTANGTLGGTGTIALNSGTQLNITGTLDLNSLTFDVSAFSGTSSPITIVDYTGGALSNVPADLQTILTNSPLWTLSDTGTSLQVIPEPSTFSMLAGALALGIVFNRRRMR